MKASKKLIGIFQGTFLNVKKNYVEEKNEIFVSIMTPLPVHPTPKTTSLYVILVNRNISFKKKMVLYKICFNKKIKNLYKNYITQGG